jgi:prepilin-type processing-associated H-X9-DG protein
MQCTNHLKQWGLAMHTFHDAHNRLPDNGGDKIWWDGYTHSIFIDGRQRQSPIEGGILYSWRTVLLPFMEQNGIYDELNAGLTWATSLTEAEYPATVEELAVGVALVWRWNYDTSTTNVHGKTEHPGSAFFPTLGCPSDGFAKKAEGDVSPSNYVGCNGDSDLPGAWYIEHGREMAARGVVRPGQNTRYGRALTFTEPYASPNTVNGEDKFIGQGRHGEMSLASITDGTSNTMVISETAVGIATDPGERDIKRGVAANTGAIDFWFGGDDGTGDPAGGRGRPTDCIAARGSGVIKDDYAVLPFAKAGRWLDARPLFSIYKAAVPPNSPSCMAANPADELQAVESHNMLSASSFHTGGVNVCMADGAVRFVSDSVDCGSIDQNLGAPLSVLGEGYKNYKTDGTNTDRRGLTWLGESTYGVWGALATPAHGESKSL